MKRLLYFGLLLALAIPTLATDLILKNSPVQVYFSPNGGAQEAVIGEIGKARIAILVQARAPLPAPIVEALKKAHARGVKVEAVLAQGQGSARHPEAAALKDAGIPVYTGGGTVAHTMVLVIDDATVATGSFTFTSAAGKPRDEDLLIIQDAGLAKGYRENWAASRGRPGEER